MEDTNMGVDDDTNGSEHNDDSNSDSFIVDDASAEDSPDDDNHECRDQECRNVIVVISKESHGQWLPMTMIHLDRDFLWFALILFTGSPI